jgi:hypothetical protein
MKQIFVNQIYEDKGITHGIVGSNKTTLENIKIIFTGEKFKIISQLLSRPPLEGFHTVDRFCQYIVLTQLHPQQGLSMKISDFHNDLDSALDEYNELIEKDWEKKTRDKIMRLFQDIKSNPKELAEMIVVPIIL